MHACLPSIRQGMIREFIGVMRLHPSNPEEAMPLRTITALLASLSAAVASPPDFGADFVPEGATIAVIGGATAIGRKLIEEIHQALLTSHWDFACPRASRGGLCKRASIAACFRAVGKGNPSTQRVHIRISLSSHVLLARASGIICLQSGRNWRIRAVLTAHDPYYRDENPFRQDVLDEARPLLPLLETKRTIIHLVESRKWHRPCAVAAVSLKPYQSRSSQAERITAQIICGGGGTDHCTHHVQWRPSLATRDLSISQLASGTCHVQWRQSLATKRPANLCMHRNYAMGCFPLFAQSWVDTLLWTPGVKDEPHGIFDDVAAAVVISAMAAGEGGIEPSWLETLLHAVPNKLRHNNGFTHCGVPQVGRIAGSHHAPLLSTRRACRLSRPAFFLICAPRSMHIRAPK